MRHRLLILSGAACTIGAVWIWLSCSGRPSARHRLDLVQADFITFDRGFASYGVDRCGAVMPPDTTLTGNLNPPTLTTTAVVSSPVRSFGDWSPLTTPIAYLVSLPTDPFHPGNPYGYVCPEAAIPANQAVLGSAGPDGDVDVDFLTLRGDLAAAAPPGQIWNDLAVAQFAASRLTPLIYDPTNGFSSSGDILRVYHCNRPVWGSWLPGGPEAPLARPLENMPVEGKALPAAEEPIATLRRRDEAGFFILISTLRRDPSGWKRLVGTARNRLGPDFVPFITSPHPLNAAELEACERWRLDAGGWWLLLGDLVAAPRYTTRLSPPPTDAEFATVLGALPLVGKSLAVLAAREQARGHPGESERALSALARLTPDASWAASDPWAARVREELGRIGGALRSVDIGAQGSP